MSFTLTCSGPITVDLDNEPACADGWIIEEYNTWMTAAEFDDLWPSLLLLFVTAVGVKYVIRMFWQNAGRGL